MRVWRLQQRGYEPLDGEGARRHGGRWNSRDVAVVYTSPTLSLATLELLAHLDPDLVPDDLAAYAIEIPDDLQHRRVVPADLPPNWREPEDPYCKQLGDEWVREGRMPLLVVPSVIVPEESNILINPGHRASARIAVAAVRPFIFDPRLLG
jgi:RES domain-containing protein